MSKHNIKNESNMETEEALQILEHILPANGFKNPEIHLMPGSIKGDNYIGLITRADIKENNKELNVIIKSAPKSEAYRKVTPIDKLFVRENFMYTDVFPAFCKFQKEQGIELPFNSYPRHYYSSNENLREVLVLDNIKLKGFKLWNRKVQMDDDHLSFIFKEYGNFHALSFALKDVKCEEFKKLEDVVQNDPFVPELELQTEKLMEETMVPFHSAINGVIEIFNDDINMSGIKDALIKLRDGLMEFFVSEAANVCPYSVITHGDCWCNNMMFQYEDEENPKKPTAINLLDFQISKRASPIYDLAYCFYASATKEAMDNIDKYLKIYHDSLTEHMKKLGSDATRIYPFDVFMKEWNRLAKFGFILGLLVFRVTLSEEDDIIDLEEAAKGGTGNMFEAFCSDHKNSGIMKKRLTEIACHLYEKKYI